MHDHGASAQYNNQQSTSDRLTRIECTVDAIASTLTEHVEIQKQDKNVDQLLIAELKVRLARLESIHEKEDAVKAAMAKWVKWFYGVGAAILGVLFSEAMRRLPLRIAIFASSALLASVISYAANAATYYVATNGSNANAGSSEAPWQTIAFAATKVIAGDTVIVKSGTYATSLRTTLSGTANARIRYVSEPRGGAVIVPPPNNSSDTAWEQVGDYVTIDGFAINGSAHQSGTRWRTGIKASGAYNTVQGVTIRNIGNLEPNVASYGVWGTPGATNVEILASAVFDIGAAGTTDTSAPSQPQNVTVNATSSSQLSLTWSASSDDNGISGYRIYRCVGSSCTPGTTVHATSSGTSYSDTGLSSNTTYGYKVSAYDISGNEGQSSSTVRQTTLPANLVWADEFDTLDLAEVTPAPNNWGSYWKQYNVHHLEGNEDKAWKDYDERLWGGKTLTVKQVIEAGNPTPKSRYLHDVSNGTLKLRGYKATAPQNSNIWGFPYVAGMISSEWNPARAKATGYWETRFKVNSLGKGHHVAIWLLPQSGNWPPEVDILELVNNTGKWYANLHGEQPNDIPISESTLTNPSGWHTHAVEITNTHVRVFRDGTMVLEHPNVFDHFNNTGKVADDAPLPPMAFMISPEFGGKWPGAPDGTTPWPFEVEVDYVRYYSSKPVPPPPSGEANVDGLPSNLIAFNQPSRETLQSSPKKVFAHWHQYPISRNKEGPTGDWYSAFSRVRTLPLRRPARTSGGDTEWRIEDALFDIQQARRIGVDAFFVNMYREDQTNPWAWPMWDYMLKAASRDNKGFKVAPNFDCSGGGDASQGTALANMASNWLDAIGEKNSAHHMKVDNKFIVGTYWVNNCQPQHYSNFKSRMSELGMPVFLVCVMSGPYNSAYDSVCDAWSNWGERGADAAVNLNYTSPSEFGTKAGIEPIMAAISVGDVRYPVGDTHRADEQKGFGTLANTWGEAIGLTDWAQLVTWNDIGEHSHFYPGTGMGYSQYDLTAFYIAWFKTGVMPAINKDAIYYSHRIANVPSGSGMPNLRSGSWANNVYAVFMLTDTATVQIITASGTTQQQLAAGVHTISAPMPLSGRPRFKIIRNSQTVVDVTSSYNIAAMPTPNDVVYRGGGSLRTIYGQSNSASTVCASGTADQCLNVNSEPVWLAK